MPAVVTISLAIGVQRLVKRNALIRRLTAVEALGSTTIICSDKTGTLTKDEMTARRLFVENQTFEISGVGYEPVGRVSPATNGEGLHRLLKAAALASDAHIVQDETTGQWEVRGDPTEGALVTAAQKAGLKKDALDDLFPRLHEIPFTAETKRMTTLHQTPAGVVAYSKGAPEVILPSCTLAASDREMILDNARRMAGDALRVLAVAMKPRATCETAEQDMTFLGLVGMIDPPRPEAAAAVQKCKKAGIKVVMVTGDHPLTARAVASELGILTTGSVLTGRNWSVERQRIRPPSRVHRSLCAGFARYRTRVVSPGLLTNCKKCQCSRRDRWSYSARASYYCITFAGMLIPQFLGNPLAGLDLLDFVHVFALAVQSAVLQELPVDDLRSSLHQNIRFLPSL